MSLDSAAEHAAAEVGTPVAVSRLRVARRWLRAFRRTRPFWGGLWMAVGGFWIIKWSMVSWSVVIATGLTGVGGWLTGGGLILCGLGAWAAPSQRYVTGIVGLVLAVLSLIVSNLGGFFLGMLLGIIGGAMTVAWGPKRPRRTGPRQFRIGKFGLVPTSEVPVVEPRRPRPFPAGADVRADEPTTVA